MKGLFKIACAAMCCAICFTAAPAGAGTVKIGADSGLNVAVTSPDDSQILIEYTLGEFEQKGVSINGERYQSLALKKEAWLLKKGEPKLPKVTRSIAIPENGNMALQVVEEEYIEFNMKVAPSKGILMRTVNIDDVPHSFSKVYQTDAFYPGKRAELGTPYQLRNVRGVTVDVYPFAYNPVTQTLRVYTRLVVSITNTATGSFNSLMMRSAQSSDTYFKSIYENHFINFTSPDVAKAAVGETGRMIVICHDAFCNAAQPYVDWKNQKGISTTKVAVSTIGNNYTAIKNYIQTEYDKNDGLTFVQLVGDASHVQPFYSGSEAQDPSYSLLAGNDNYPDILVGRFSAESVADVDTQVARTIYYERDMPSAAWQNQGMGIASSEGAGSGDDGEADWQHMRNIRTDLLGYKYTLVDELYDGSQGGADSAGNPTDQMVASALNSGRSLVNYTGHGSSTSFATTGFNNTDVNNLQNTNKLPLVVAVACVVGQFHNTTSFSEVWMRATYNGDPTGAIGFYGATINQSWQPPMSAQDEIVDLMVAQTYTTTGGLLFNGSIKMMDEYGSDGVHMFKTWHIFGDASLAFNTSSTTPPPQYCTSESTDSSYEYVKQVNFGTMQNASGAAGYTDFTSIVASASRNQSYTITLTPGFSGGSYNENWKVWIDFNQNKTFDTGELVFSSSGSSAAVSGSVIIPSTALTGDTRMRVIMGYNAIDSACGSYRYGETEDYTVRIN
ncbi:MAG: C25 family cysteine peptidase [Desulfobacter sp.]